MGGVIDADGDDFADPRHRRAEPDDALDEGQRVRFQLGDLRQPVGRQEGAVNVIDLVGQVPDSAFFVQQAGFLLTLGAVTQQFHDSSEIPLKYLGAVKHYL